MKIKVQIPVDDKDEGIEPVMLQLVLLLEDEDTADDEDSNDEEIELLDEWIADDEDNSDEDIELLDVESVLKQN